MGSQCTAGKHLGRWMKWLENTENRPQMKELAEGQQNAMIVSGLRDSNSRPSGS